MKFHLQLLLGICLLATLLTGLEAQAGLDIKPFKIDIHADKDFDFEKAALSLSFKWNCRKHKTFAEPPQQPCGKKYEGELTVTVNKNGSADFPGINVSKPRASRYEFSVEVAISQVGGQTQALGYFGGFRVKNPTAIEKIPDLISELHLLQIKAVQLPIDLGKQKTSAVIAFSHGLTPSKNNFYPFYCTSEMRQQVSYEDGMLTINAMDWFIAGEFKEGDDIGVTITPESHKESYAIGEYPDPPLVAAVPASLVLDVPTEFITMEQFLKDVFKQKRSKE